MQALISSVVSIATALIGGMFLLYNSTSRRVERLKHLVEIRNEVPEWLNRDYEIERLIADEIYAIAISKTATSRRLALTLILVAYVAVVANVVVVLQAPAQSLWPYVPIGLCVVSAATLVVIERRQVSDVTDRYQRARQDIEHRAQERQAIDTPN